MIRETLAATGKLNIVLTNKSGTVKETREVPNLVVTVGKEYIASRMTDTTQPDMMSHMAVGTTATPVAATQTTLALENGRAALTGGEGAPADATIVYTATFAAGTGTGALVEAGIFNSATTDDGAMLCRTIFAAVNKGIEDSVTITWTVTIGSAA